MPQASFYGPLGLAFSLKFRDETSVGPPAKVDLLPLQLLGLQTNWHY